METNQNKIEKELYESLTIKKPESLAKFFNEIRNKEENTDIQIIPSNYIKSRHYSRRFKDIESLFTTPYSFSLAPLTNP